MRYIDCALNGPAGSNLSYFFLGDQYVVFDWAKDKAVIGARSIAQEWALPFLGPIQVQAALSAHEAGVATSAKYSYFFKDLQYARYEWASPPPRPSGGITSINAWHIPSPPFSRVDAALNGKVGRKGKTYFFYMGEFVEYDWASDTCSAAAPLTNLVPGLSAQFAGGFDAALNGQGQYADYAYLFKDGDYLKLKWPASAGGLITVVDQRPIVGNWTGVVELLLAGQAKTKVFEWLWSVIPQVVAYRGAVALGLPYLDAPLMQSALVTHFRLLDPEDLVRIDFILTRLQAIEQKLHNAPDIYASATDEELKQAERVVYKRDATDKIILDANGKKMEVLGPDGRVQPDCAAYTSFGGRTVFTRAYPTKGVACRVAQIIHEMGHYLDNQADQYRDVPEWYVTLPTATLLGIPFQDDSNIISRYDEMDQDVAIHNPSSYAAFLAHVRYRQDVRYGELVQNPVPGLVF